jgi:MarR family transcriptional regulator, temperature-dependent positive regulator of motility
MRRSPLHLLHRAEQAADRLFLAGALGFVTPRQLAVLIAVAESKGGNLNHVIKHTGIDRSTTSNLVGRMTRMGLLQKRRSRRDTRSSVLRLTQEGRQLLDNATPVARNIDDALLQALPQARREPFLQALRAIVAQLESPPQ